ncbi:MAG: hypothetical protein JNN05_07030, partial [Candidatus Omnitrophica bacterium]|nr:hypothetical protein [Candidatus Omnitrophota bacterium]
MIIKNVKIVILLTFLAGLSPQVFGADTQELKGVYNSAIKAVVDEIVSMKNSYPELEGFSISSIQQDSRGFSRVYYAHDPGLGDSKDDPYGFELVIDAEPFEPSTDATSQTQAQLTFPLLGIKVVARAERKGASASFDVTKIVESHMDVLNDLEQKFLPFQLDLKPQKEIFDISEDMSITVSLVNSGAKGFRVADLNEKSLYCTFADRDWGTQEGPREF